MVKKKKIKEQKKKSADNKGFIATQTDSYLKFLSQHRRLFETCLIVAIIVFGILLRLSDLSHWNENRQRAFVDGQPLHTTFDAWFYLSLAKDLVDGTYHNVDEKRGVPECPPRPVPPPLLSVLAAGIAKLTTFSLSWIGAVIPVLLGPLISIPVFLIGKIIGGYMMAVSASLLCVVYPFYVIRSSIGRFDTDCLIVTFCLILVWLFIKFGTLKTPKQYLYLFFSFIVYLLFLWWWDQAHSVVTAFYLFMFAVTVMVFYRPQKKEALLFFGGIIIFFLVFVSLKGLGVVVDIVDTLWSKYLYISKYTGVYPNIGLTISEQSRPTISMLLNYTTVNLPSLIFAITGIFLLYVKKTKYAIVMLPMTVLSFLAVTYANRFIIFLVPMIAVGAGYLLSVLWDFRQRYKVLFIICPIVLVFFSATAFFKAKAFIPWPKEHGKVAEGMVLASEITPSDSVIWAWWDHGYAITYLARRATINDGSIHSGERTMYNAIPFRADSQRMSANFMHFYVKHGMKGMRLLNRALDYNRDEALELLEDILASGPREAKHIIEESGLLNFEGYESVDDWLKFFFPGVTRPVYLFLDNLLTRTAYWWYWFASWNFETQTGDHPLYRVYYGVRIKDNAITGRKGLHIDMDKGIMHANGRQVMLSDIVIRTRTGILDKSFKTESPLKFELYEPAGMGVLLDRDIAGSVFHRLFVLNLADDQYFKSIKTELPFYQIWEVRADSFDG